MRLENDCDFNCEQCNKYQHPKKVGDLVCEKYGTADEKDLLIAQNSLTVFELNELLNEIPSSMIMINFENKISDFTIQHYQTIVE